MEKLTDPRIAHAALTRVESTPSFYPSSTTNGITMELLPIFKFLRILGRCPLLFEISENQGLRVVRYRFKLCRDSYFVASAFAAVFVSVCCVLEVVHSFSKTDVFGELWPSPYLDTANVANWETIEPIPRILLNSFELTFTLMVVLEYFIVWVTSPNLEKWLNDWHEIDRDFKTYFGILYDPDLSKLRNYFIIPYIAIPTVSLGMGLADFLFDIKYPFGAVVLMTACFVSNACYLAEDAKVFMMFKAIEISFKQVSLGVKMRFEKRTMVNKMTLINDDLAIKEVQGWQKLLIKIRHQAESAGKYLAVHQLISIATLLYFAAAALFIIANTLSHQDGYMSYAIPTVTIFSIMADVRLFIKISLAVRITQEEKRLAWLLKDLELIEDNVKCKHEVKGIYDMISHNPTEISLDNYVYLNSSLILRILGQILTQFIVFMQFQNST